VGNAVTAAAMIVDMRVRPPLPAWTSKPQFQQGNYYPARAGFPRPRSSVEQSMALLLREMDEAGVRLGVVSGRQAKEPLGTVANDDVAAVLAAHPDRFVGFAAVDAAGASEVALAEIDRCLALPGFKGVVVEPAAATTPMMLDDRRLYPIYAHCQEREVPLAVTLSAELVRLVGNPWPFASPMPLYAVAQDFPRLQIVITHAAWPAVQEVLGLAFAFPNVWLSPDLYMVGVNMPFAREYVRAANLYLGERLLFGTGYPSRGHVDSVRAFDAWSFAPGVKENVQYRNALRLLRMDR
jgi:uncharacterized protein